MLTPAVMHTQITRSFSMLFTRVLHCRGPRCHWETCFLGPRPFSALKPIVLLTPVLRWWRRVLVCRPQSALMGRQKPMLISREKPTLLGRLRQTFRGRVTVTVLNSVLPLVRQLVILTCITRNRLIVIVEVIRPRLDKFLMRPRQNLLFTFFRLLMKLKKLFRLIPRKLVLLAVPVALILAVKNETLRSFSRSPPG